MRRRQKGRGRTASGLRKYAESPEALRQALGILEPPVRARQVAEALGLSVESLPPFETGLLHALTYTLDGRPRIVVNGHKPEAIVNFGIAHELYEAILPDRVTGATRHTRANQLASELLLPEIWVRQAMELTGFDLVALAQKFWVSCEAMALRLMQLCSLGVTIVDNGQVVRRVASGDLVMPTSLLPEEKETIRTLAAGIDRTEKSGEGFKILAFRVPGDAPVVRFILLAIPTTL